MNADIRFSDEKSDITGKIKGKLREETFYARGNTFLNRNELNLDKTFYTRHIMDVSFLMGYGKRKYEDEVVNLTFTLRNRANFGSTSANGVTTESAVRLGDSIFGNHRHTDTRLKITLRELWLSFNMSKTLGLTFLNTHTFKVGIFPFKLGRGISLGEAYAVGPSFLGFYNEAVIDQFAPGAEITGDFIPDILTYDFYVAIIENLSNGLGETGVKIHEQEFGRRCSPERGFGVINFLTAARFFWTAFDNNLGSCVIEPYLLYNNAPEQMVEFRADSNSKLGTAGLATEYKGDIFEFGCEYAANFGRQKVKGWDRNDINITNINAALTEVNSQALVGSATSKVKVPHDTSTAAGREAQGIIDSTFQNESENGAFIGTVDDGFAGLTGPVNIYNSKDRFKNPYNNTYKGYMFICDGAVFALNKDLRFAAMAGVASGDDDPNSVTKDGDYRGFIGLQEIYTGDRVSSAFLLGGAGKIKRFLGNPNASALAPGRLSSTISGFTNIIFVGTSMKWEPVNAGRRFKVHPNILAYWQESPTRRFDLASRMDSDKSASTYLGTEVNTFFDFNLAEPFKFYVVWSAFIPGKHYTDLKGKPTTKDQIKALEAFVKSGHPIERVPNISDDVAFTLNLGLEYKF
jgi:hypothetical protein